MKKRSVGRMVLYRLDEGASIADELRRIFLKTEGLGAQLLAGIGKKERKKIRFALIYGSLAKGVGVASSDIDLLVIGSVDEDAVLKSVMRTERETGRQVILVLWTENEFLEKAGLGTPLVRELAEIPVIMIVGGSDEFRRFVK
ncbi:MAG: nucleotidyltransferase domain-containing protein [Thaumarchaeota archaeon]|nr:nucleotidyltransferase domain-containing protein [Nitrososphaerota archaeon]